MATTSATFVAVLVSRPEGPTPLTPMLLSFDSRQRQLLREYLGYMRPLFARRRDSDERN
jgi:hypothetical protein